MGDEAQKIARRIGYAMFLPLVVGLPIALFAKGIDIPVFGAVATLWLAVALFLIIGPESVSEITFWKASIKRDVKAAEAARSEAEAVRDELRIALRALVDSSEIAFSVSLIVECSEQVLQRRRIAVQRLLMFAEPDEHLRAEWEHALNALPEGPYGQMASNDA